MKTVIREKRYQIRIDYTDNHWKRLWKNLNKPSSHNDDNILAGTGSCCRTLDARPDNRAIEPWKCHRSSHRDRIIQEYWPLVSPLSPSAEAAELFLPTTCEEEEKRKGELSTKAYLGIQIQREANQHIDGPLPYLVPACTSRRREEVSGLKRTIRHYR